MKFSEIINHNRTLVFDFTCTVSKKKNTELAGKKMRNMSRASNCAYLLRIESRIHLVHKSRQMYRKRRHICVKFRSTINYFLNRRIIAIELHKITSYGFKIG